MLDGLQQDVRFAARTLRRSPGFAIVVIITLAISTGATTAIFSIVNGVLIRPLPFPEASRLVQVSETWPNGGPGLVLGDDLDAFRRESTLFEGFATHYLTTRHLDTPGGLERLSAVVVDRDFFSVLGTEPMIGRTIRATDRGQLVVLSHHLWQRQFARSPAVIDQPIPLAGQRFDPQQKRTVVETHPFVVVGVMPAGFQYPYAAGSTYPTALPEAQTDIWIFDDRMTAGRRFDVTARLKGGVSIETAGAELATIKQRVDRQSTNQFRTTAVHVARLADVVLGPVRRSLWLLFGAVGLLIVAACVNIANLALARTLSRTREIVTRAALGAGRLRLVRQMLVESLVLSAAGAAAAAGIAWWGLRLLITVGAARIPRAQEIALDWTAFAFLFLICGAAAVLFGLGPALAAALADLNAATRESAGHATAGRGFARMRNALVIAQVAVAFVLGSAAVIVISELNRLRATDMGMSTANVLTLHMTPRATPREYFEIEQRLRQIAGVESAGLSHLLPLQNWGSVVEFGIRGRNTPDGRGPRAELIAVTPGYFDALGITLLRGRQLASSDGPGAPPVVVINQSLARRYFPNEDPVGQQTNRGTIVGVVRDVRIAGLDEPVFPAMYQPVNENSGIAADIGMSLIVRTRLGAEAAVRAVKDAVREVNPALALFNVKTMDQVVWDSLWELNLYRWLIGLFAAIAIVLTAIGLFGVISYVASARVREFAIRVALGSAPAALGRQVVGSGLLLTAAGLGAGGAACVLLARVLADWPIAAQATPGSFGLVALGLIAISVIACAVPALRVSAVNPVTALRQD